MHFSRPNSALASAKPPSLLGVSVEAQGGPPLGPTNVCDTSIPRQRRHPGWRVRPEMTEPVIGGMHSHDDACDAYRDWSKRRMEYVSIAVVARFLLTAPVVPGRSAFIRG